jgi:prevent-host-death family protein
MPTTVSATKARIHFGEMMDRVAENQETIIVERSGTPQMVLISVTAYEALKANAAQNTPSWKELVQASRNRIAAELGDRRLPPSEEIIRQMREDRDAYLLDLR